LPIRPRIAGVTTEDIAKAALQRVGRVDHRGAGVVKGRHGHVAQSWVPPAPVRSSPRSRRSPRRGPSAGCRQLPRSDASSRHHRTSPRRYVNIFNRVGRSCEVVPTRTAGCRSGFAILSPICSRIGALLTTPELPVSGYAAEERMVCPTLCWRKADSNRWSHLRLNGSDTGECDEQIAISPLHRIDEQSLERSVIAPTFSAGPYSGAVQPGGGRLGREVRICDQRHSRGTHTRFAGLIATEKPEHVSVFKCSDFKAFIRAIIRSRAFAGVVLSPNRTGAINVATPEKCG
jgi:hypothetical protein